MNSLKSQRIIHTLRVRDGLAGAETKLARRCADRFMSKRILLNVTPDTRIAVLLSDSVVFPVSML